MGLLDAAFARNPQEAMGLLSAWASDPAGNIGRGLLNALGAEQKAKQWGWNGLDAMTGSSDTRSSVDAAAINDALNTAFAGTFAGPMAKTANLAKLKVAEQMSIPARPKNHLGQEIPQTQYEIAHEVAQRNAALPLKQGGLGLPPNNTAMDRAKAMGFDTPAFHGTHDDFTAFDQNKYDKRGAFVGNAAFVDTAFPPRQANKYADDPYFTGNEGGNVLPLLVKKGKAHRKIDWENLYGRESDILRKGYSSVNINEGGTEKSLAILDPSNIRSRFAAFDPMKRNSADLLAGLAPYALPSGLFGLLATQPDYAQARE